MTLPAFAAERRAPAADIAGARRSQLSIDICCPCPRSAANQPHVAAAVDRRHRRTDGRTDARPLHRVGANYIQGGDADVSCSAWFRTTLLGVVIHMCRRHAAPTQAQVRLH